MSDKMILEEATFKKFGYYPSALTHGSTKPVIVVCDDCGKVWETSMHHYYALCTSCAQKRKTLSEDHKANISAALKGIKRKTRTEDHKANLSAAKKGKFCGIDNPNWLGGISFEPYCIKFNATYKREVRTLFGNKCFLCGKSAEENGRALDVHHVNYNKNCGCDETKCVCVPLCVRCHSKTNHKRKYWERKIKNKLRETLLGY
jgi:hypothetical protein